MSVTIRLSRIGRKNQPSYKLVVSNTRNKRDGKFVDILGHYDPFSSSEKFSYDKEKFEKWVKQGALVTDAVTKIIEGKYEFIKYEPKKVAKEERDPVDQEKPKEVTEEPAKQEEPKEVIEEPAEEEKGE